MIKNNYFDVAIVGAGIVGLAHALACAKRGLKVIVFERNPAAVGASIRNFGMIWPIGQPQGLLYERAIQSREIWLELAAKGCFHADRSGSLHLAYRQDELDVIEEFIATRKEAGYSVELLNASQVPQKSQAAVTEGLLGALWSETEVIVDPREAIEKIPGFLSELYHVEFQFSTVVTDISYPKLTAGGKTWKAEQIIVCSGSDFETLYPEIFTNSGITKVKLQMMRTKPQPENWRLGAALCGGLTLTHYAAFAHCKSLIDLKRRIETETPYFFQWHIHVMMSQNASGELIIGDHHEYGLNPDPFDRVEINDYILDYLKNFALVPSPEISATWHGVYAKLIGKTELIARPEPGVIIVSALGGAGMTLSFGLAEEVVSNL